MPVVSWGRELARVPTGLDGQGQTGGGVTGWRERQKGTDEIQIRVCRFNCIHPVPPRCSTAPVCRFSLQADSSGLTLELRV